jgi:DNA uptake protein ComE-like DNA-binding protein
MSVAVDGATERDCIASILVVYNNGHSITPADRCLPIQQSFAARVIHQFFCDDIPQKMVFSQFMDIILEKRRDVAKLDLISALQYIRRALVTAKLLNPSGILRVFLGVDEFQAIEDCQAVDGGGPSVLRRLANHLLDTSIQLRSQGIHLFSVMAGTEWQSYSDFGSGEVMLKKISLHYLTVEGTQRISRFLIPQALQSAQFLGGLTAFGDTPRTCVEFCRAICLLKAANTKSIKQVRQTIMANYLNRFRTVLSPNDMIRLAAFGILQESCFPDVPSSIAGLTWQHLANGGLLQLLEDDLVVVSFSVFVHVATYSNRTGYLESGSVEDNFVQCACQLVELVDANREPWQKWEDFGAYYHALRMNAYVLTGRLRVDLKVLFKEVYHGRSKIVTLRKSQVVIAEEQLHSSTDLTRVAEAGNCLCQVSAIDPETCYVFLNSTGGKGVDIFFLLETAHEQILILDQRKLDNITLSTKIVQEYHQKMVSVHPLVVGSRPVSPIYLLASARSRAGPRLKKPERLCMITHNTLRRILGPMLTCALSFVKLNPNTTNVTALSQLLGIDNEQAHMIMRFRLTSPVTSFNQLSDWVRQVSSHTLDPSVRSSLLLQDADDEMNQDDDEDEIENMHGEEGDDL